MKDIFNKKIFSNLVMIIVIIAFVNIFSNVFHKSNTLIGVAIITGILMFNSISIGINIRQAPLLILLLFIGIGISTQLSLVNSYLGFIVNFVSIFLIMILSSEHLEYKTYMPFILCYVFAQGNPVKLDDFYFRMFGLAAGGILTGIVYFIWHRKNTSGESISIVNVFKHIDITSARFELALKMAIGLAVSMFIGQIWNLQKAMWISISVMSLTQITFKQTKQRIVQRIIFTIIGSVAFVVLYVILIPKKYILITTLILSYIYTFIKEYRIQMIFITINSLNASMILFHHSVAIPMRIAFVIIGAIIAYIVNSVKIKTDNIRFFNFSKQC